MKNPAVLHQASAETFEGKAPNKKTITPRRVTTARKGLTYPGSDLPSPSVSPLQSYILHQKSMIDDQEQTVFDIEKERDIFVQERAPKQDVLTKIVMPTCSKCHLKEGHNRLNCPYPNHCSSSIFCKNVEKHPEDKQAIKEFNKRLGEERKRLSSMKEELKNRENACESVKNRYVNRVKETLIASDPEKYITEIDGKSIENWRLINMDSKILEREFRGKIPSPEEAREAILSLDSLAPQKTGKTTVHEPYKRLWESKGISWPKRHSSSSRCSSQKFLASEDKTVEYDIDAALRSPQRKKTASERIYQDDYQLALGMQKSYETLPESFNLNAFEGILNSNSNNDPDETQDPNIVSNVEKSVGAATPVVEHLEPTSSAGSSLIHLTEGDELPGETFRRLNLYDLAEAALQTFEEC